MHLQMLELGIHQTLAFDSVLQRALSAQVFVTTSKQRTITAKRVALTVGAWTNEVLAHLGMQLSLEIWKVHWGHYYVDPALQHRLPQWYKFCKLRPDSWDEGLYYGFPPEDSRPVVKAGSPLAASNDTRQPSNVSVGKRATA